MRLVNRETVRMFDATGPDGRMVGLNGVGEAHVRFDNPVMYLGHNLQWDHGGGGWVPHG